MDIRLLQSKISILTNPYAGQPLKLRPEPSYIPTLASGPANGVQGFRKNGNLAGFLEIPISFLRSKLIENQGFTIGVLRAFCLQVRLICSRRSGINSYWAR